MSRRAQRFFRFPLAPARPPRGGGSAYVIRGKHRT